jgi:hypothetical protein
LHCQGFDSSDIYRIYYACTKLYLQRGH